MPETRYNELLGLSPEVGDPDYYQLLELERGWVDTAEVEERFKQQMVKLQNIHSPKHKEFIEFLKGELKKARGILTDPVRRRQYDAEVKQERTAELRKLAQHMLVDGTLSQQGEISLVEEGKRIGLEVPDIKRVIEQELKTLGAARVTAKRTDVGTQAAANTIVRDAAHQLEEARIAARFAEAKAKHAEQARERAEEQALMAMKREKEARVLVRQTVTRESLTAAVDEQEREHLETQIAQSQQQLEEKERELETLRQQLKALQHNLENAEGALSTVAARGSRMDRMLTAISVATAFVMGGQAVRVWLPTLTPKLDAIAIWSVQRGVGVAAGALGAVGLVLLVVIGWLAGRTSRLPYLAGTIVLAVVAGAAGAVYLR